MCVNVFSLRAVCSREMESKTASHTNEAMQQQQQQVQQQQEAQEQEGRFGTKASTAAPAGQKFKTLHKNSMPKNAQSDKNPMQLQCTRHEQKQKKKQNPAKRKRRSAKGKQKSQKQQKTPTASTEVVAAESPAPKEWTKDEIMRGEFLIFELMHLAQYVCSDSKVETRLSTTS